MQAPGLNDAASTRLRRKIDLVLPALLDAAGRLVRHPRVKDLYPEYLFMSHCIIRASVPLMEAAKRRAQVLADDHSVAAELAAYLEQHVVEELHHDEWLLDDLEALGVGRSTVLARPPSPTVAAFVGSQYYWIFHYHPVALLGWIALLEGYPPSVEVVDELMARTGYGPEAFRTMIAHAELDPHHRDDFNEMLDRLPLTRDQSTVIGLSALASVDMLARVIDEVVDGAGEAPEASSLPSGMS